jgi:hypothetical protein
MTRQSHSSSQCSGGDCSSCGNLQLVEGGLLYCRSRSIGMHEHLISIGILSITSRDILPIRYGILPLNTTIFSFSIRYLNSLISIMMSSRVNLNSIILNAVCKLCILILIKRISMVEVSLNVLDYPDVCWKYNWYILFPMKKGIFHLCII